MSTVRFVTSIMLTLVLVVGTAAHGARATQMAMPVATAWSADSAEPCGLSAGEKAETAAHCALICAGMIGMLGDPAALAEPLSGQRVAPSPLAVARGFAVPEPDPPR